ncbi:hypothetical protein D7X25_26885 [bacterium 1XD42-8]|nr:hypothetical protein D7X25_26885 [bacterium 1XD42-8]
MQEECISLLDKGTNIKRQDCIEILQKTNRRTMDFTRHMRRSAFFPGRPGGLITEITWKAGE